MRFFEQQRVSFENKTLSWRVRIFFNTRQTSSRKKIKRFKVNREQVAKVIKSWKNVYYYVKINNYLFMSDEEYYFIIHEIINLIAKSRHAKIKCVWQLNDLFFKRILFNKNKVELNFENFSKSQNIVALSVTIFTITKNLYVLIEQIQISSYITIENIIALIIASVINMFNNCILSFLKLIFDDNF